MKQRTVFPHLRSYRHPVPKALGAGRYRFDQQPWLVYWELTRACELACHHCRAEAIAHRHPLELSTAEARAVLESVRRFGRRPPHVVITGGDPLWRPDLFDLIAYGRQLGLGVSLAPSVTDRLDRQVIRRLRELRVATVALSLDGDTAELHDGIRGVPGSFERTIHMARAVVEEGLDLQINTLVTADTLGSLKRVYRLVSHLGAMRWSLFFLIQVGRGSALTGIRPEEAEGFLGWLGHRLLDAPMQIKATEAPQLRRVVIQQFLAAGLSVSHVRQLPFARGFGIRDGNGIVFISHTGKVYPSGFLPLEAGDLRQGDLVDIYRNAHWFRRLRDPDGYVGKCGRCEYRYICGGSRARAFAATGDPLESDPLCPYEPGTSGQSQ